MAFLGFELLVRRVQFTRAQRDILAQTLGVIAHQGFRLPLAGDIDGGTAIAGERPQLVEQGQAVEQNPA